MDGGDAGLGHGAATDKAALRRRVLARRRKLPTTARTAAGAAISDAMRDHVLAAALVALYVPLPDEPDTACLLDLRPDALLPVLLADRDLAWRTAAGERLDEQAIARCDLLVVPALAVDAHGVRLGRGGGSYDRALARSSGLTVAVVYDDELVDRLPSQPHDVGVAGVVTPSGGLQLLGQ